MIRRTSEIAAYVALFILMPGLAVAGTDDDSTHKPSRAISGGDDSPTLLLTNLTIVDVTGGSVLKKHSILIEGRSIKTLCVADATRPPDADRSIDLTGHYAIPGLIESHTHITGQPEVCLQYALRSGITTIRDMGGDGEYLKELQTAIQDGELIGPDVYFAALMGGDELMQRDTRVKLSTPTRYALGAAPWMRSIRTESNMANVVSEAKACGATGIKLYAYLSRDVVRRLTDEGHRQGMKVWSHSVVYPAGVRDVVEAGADVISHAPGLLYPSDWQFKKSSALAIDPDLLNSPQLDNVLDLMKEKGTILDTTLAVFDELLSKTKDSKHNARTREYIYSVVRLAHRKGICLIAGTDYPLPRSAGEAPLLLTELEILVRDVGLTPTEAIRAATISAAKALGIEATHGSIEPGKIANLVILRADPTESIGNVSKVRMVIKDGQIIGRETLERSPE